MRRCACFFWRRERRLPRRFRDVPDEFTDIRSSDCRPLVFTPKRPEPLRDVSLSDISIDEEALQTASLRELSQQPVARLDPERMGLPPHLVQYLHQRFAKETSADGVALSSSSSSSVNGFKGMTMVQARALQHLYARQDVALCAPTGTGKTFALCLALVARLMRDGPMKIFSAVFLAQNDNLCRQAARWMQEMWWYESDEQLVFVATSDVPSDVVYRRLTRKVVRDTVGKVVATADRRPYVCVATPDVFWTFFQRRKEAILKREAAKGRAKHSFAIQPVLPSIDLVIVDEVDDVLPSTCPDAPGNLLMKELYRFVKYQAPIQLVFTSATLAGSTVNHVRRFLKKSVLECKTSRIFESEIEGFARNAKATGSLSKVSIPLGIQHLFYTADTIEEQRECVAAAMRETKTCTATPHDENNTQCVESGVKVLVVLPDSANMQLFAQDVLTPIQTDDRFVIVEATGDTHQERMRRRAMEYVEASCSPRLQSDKTAPPKTLRRFILCGSSCVRGLDIDDLTHVMILATPRSAIEYAHWCGRVGRFGGHGVSVVIMGRSTVRSISGFCEALSISFKMQRRYNNIDVDADRRTLGL